MEVFNPHPVQADFRIEGDAKVFSGTFAWYRDGQLLFRVFRVVSAWSSPNPVRAVREIVEDWIRHGDDYPFAMWRTGFAHYQVALLPALQPGDKIKYKPPSSTEAMWWNISDNYGYERHYRTVEFLDPFSGGERTLEREPSARSLRSVARFLR